MPLKIRELKSKLRKAGFSSRPGKGSHVVFTHSDLPDFRLTISGSDGDDAQRYQEARVRDALERLQKRRR